MMTMGAASHSRAAAVMNMIDECLESEGSELKKAASWA